MKEMKEMSIIELMEYWQTEWSKDAPLFENDRVASNTFDYLMKEKARTSTFKELIEVLHMCDEGDFDNPTFWEVRSILSRDIVGSLYDDVEQMKKSVKVLLKENEDKPANITIGQLNRLKGGINA